MTFEEQANTSPATMCRNRYTMKKLIPGFPDTHLFSGSFVPNFVSFWWEEVSEKEELSHVLPSTFSFLLCQTAKTTLDTLPECCHSSEFGNQCSYGQKGQRTEAPHGIMSNTFQTSENQPTFENELGPTKYFRV